MKIKDKLNLGSGIDYKEGWVNVDISNRVYGVSVKLDVKWDLNKFPYPFKDDTFNEILISYVLEYLDNPIKTLKEVVRIAKNNAKITIFVVHAKSNSAFSQINFKNNFTENSFNGKRPQQYDLGELKLMKTEFIFIHKWKKYLLFKKYLINFFNGLYDNIKFELQVIK